MKIFQKEKQMLLLCMVGFFVGIIGANIYFKCYGISDYISKICERGNVNTASSFYKEYMLYILYKRSVIIILAFFSCLTKCKKILISLLLVWTGFSTGIVLVLAVIDKGIFGVVLCIAALMPQAVFYLMSYYIVFRYVFEFPNIRWNMLKTIFVIISLLTGVATEVVLNPILMNFINSLLKQTGL